MFVKCKLVWLLDLWSLDLIRRWLIQLDLKVVWLYSIHRVLFHAAGGLI